MKSNVSYQKDLQISLQPINQENWRNVSDLEVSDFQSEFVADPTYYLALCSYGGDWSPLAICLGEQVIGFMMWTTDPADGSCWLGGFLIDKSLQKCGYGKEDVKTAISMLQREHGYKNFALSYQPTNLVAKNLYRKLGFIKTNKKEDSEIVAGLILTE